MKHNVMLEKNNKHFTETFYLAFVRWYKQHPEKAHFRSPNRVWYPDHVALSESLFIPISRIATRCAQKELELFVPDRPHHSEKAILICPLSMNSSKILYNNTISSENVSTKMILQLEIALICIYKVLN